MSSSAQDTPRAVVVEGVGKRYRLGASGADTLREAIGSVFSRRHDDEARTLWALRDVSFSVDRGEVVGVVGRNGAGKSTLLKILTGITEPSEGRVELRGRIASLLEVGTGFHPDLSGRENVYLNGAILGMTRQEIGVRFDEIVAFAEVERFIDTPVKRYSSGMYMRLAFAIAAHLDPEILLVDEVLAVGDAAFQRRCLGKMSEVASEGRTVLFVSHNLSAVRRLCRRAILLDRGRSVLQASADDVCTEHLRRSREHDAAPLEGRDDRSGSGEARYTAVRWQSPSGERLPSVASGAAVVLVVTLANASGRPIVQPRVSVGIDDDQGRLAVVSTEGDHRNLPALPAGSSEVRFHIDHLSLTPGDYGLVLFLGDERGVVDRIELAAGLTVDAVGESPTGWSPSAAGARAVLRHSSTAGWDNA